MSDITAVMLQDRLNDIERNAYDGIDFRQELNEAYTLADELQAENDKLRKAVATAIKVQAVLCGDADSLYCRKECPLHRQESDDCLACDVIGVAQELSIEGTDA